MRKDHKKKKNKLIKIILICLSVTALILFGIFSYSRYISFQDGETITVDGAQYQERGGLETYLLMGIDRGIEEKDVLGGVGQADLELVLVIDNKENTWQLLQINRDSLVNLIMNDVNGNPTVGGVGQITLAHSYGSTAEEGDQFQVMTVEALLDNHPMDGYMAMNMDAVGTLTDAIGGITLTIQGDFSRVDPTLVEGEEMTLTGSQALTYVRSRQAMDQQTNTARMERQKQFMAAFEEKFMSLSLPEMLKVVNIAMDEIRMDCSLWKIIRIARKVQKYEQKEMLEIEGTSSINEKTKYNEYILDDNSLQNVILELFYKPIN